MNLGKGDAFYITAGLNEHCVHYYHHHHHHHHHGCGFPLFHSLLDITGLHSTSDQLTKAYYYLL